jgi:hypothetical protein
MPAVSARACRSHPKACDGIVACMADRQLKLRVGRCAACIYVTLFRGAQPNQLYTSLVRHSPRLPHSRRLIANQNKMLAAAGAGSGH